MLNVEDALRAVRERSAPLPACRRPLADALGRPLAEDVAADLDVPPLDTALVDGYGARAAALRGSAQIRNSNAVMLGALAASSAAEAEVFPIVPDEAPALDRALRRGLDFDVLTITGGVSAGNRDLVPDALERLGVVRVFHKVR